MGAGEGGGGREEGGQECQLPTIHLVAVGFITISLKRDFRGTSIVL